MKGKGKCQGALGKLKRDLELIIIKIHCIVCKHETVKNKMELTRIYKIYKLYKYMKSLK